MIIETIKERNHTIEIFVDEFAESPREWDNVGKMVCQHGRYSLGDDQYENNYANSWREWFAYYVLENYLTLNLKCYDTFGYFEDEEEVEKVWEWIEGNMIVMPLYLYDHSGLSISTSKSCRWDSGQVGFIYITKKKAVKEWGNKYFTKAVEERAERCIEEEVSVYDNYLRGDVYGYRVSKIRNFIKVFEDGSEEFGEEPVLIDSCSGYYGDHKESGLLEDAMSLID